MCEEGGGLELEQSERVKKRREESEEGRSGRKGGGVFSFLTTVPPPMTEKKKTQTLALSPPLSLLCFFFRSCFHLAHGSAPSNSWVSQTKSYFLIHCLSHIIILLDRVPHCFFQACFSSTACSVLVLTSQPQWGEKGGPAGVKGQGWACSFTHTSSLFVLVFMCPSDVILWNTSSLNNYIWLILIHVSWHALL